MNQPKLHTGYMEVAVAMLLNYRVYTIVPNVSYGLYLNHECDMLALKDDRFTEIEIKVTAQDLKKDFTKSHGHSSRYISRLIYAVPEQLVEKAKQLCPDSAGIIGVKWVYKYEDSGLYEAYWVRQAKRKKNIEPVPESIQIKFMSLGCMRIWSLKSKNNNKIKANE